MPCAKKTLRWDWHRYVHGKIALRQSLDHFYHCTTAPPSHSFHDSEQRRQGWWREGLLGTTRAVTQMQGPPAFLCTPTCAWAAAAAGPALGPPKEPGTRAGLIPRHHHFCGKPKQLQQLCKLIVLPPVGRRLQKWDHLSTSGNFWIIYWNTSHA